MSNIDKIKNKVQKLINQANDVAGTPEADAFMARTLDLMARYGFEQRDLSTPDDGDDVITITLELKGAYSDRQARLGGSLATALHCTPIAMGRARSTKRSELHVFGKRRHVERVKLLWTLLNPQMLAQAKDTVGELWVSTTVARRSFMDGYRDRVYQRLAEAEQQAADEDVAESYALALVDDRKQAETACQQWLEDNGYECVNRASRSQVDHRSYASGVSAANRADLNQTRVGGARAAIGS